MTHWFPGLRNGAQANEPPRNEGVLGANSCNLQRICLFVAENAILFFSFEFTLWSY